ncbi:MAG: rod shape-determining protein [bacterium]|nr:rod shape-determining protein [bacterium]
MRNIYSALDIGSDAIKLVCGEFIHGKLNVLCAEKTYSLGYQNNIVSDKDELISSIKRLITICSEKLGFNIRKVILSVPVSYTDFYYTEGKVQIGSEDYTVSSEDIISVLKNASYGNIPATEELIQAIPVMFRVDSEETKTPLGMRGENLFVRTMLVASDKRFIYDFIKIVSEAGVEVADIMSPVLADYANFENTLDGKTGALINLGNTSTSIGIFSKGIFINSEILNLGGYELDRDIGLKYNLKRSDAKFVKEKFALASVKNASNREEMSLTDKNGEEIVINQKEVSELVSNRFKEVLKLAKKSINHLTKKEISYIIVTGGLTELRDAPLVIHDEFGNKARLGMINYVGARYNGYSTCIGMLLYFYSKLRLRDKEFCMITDDDIDTLVNGAREVTNDSILGKVFGYFFDN